MPAPAQAEDNDGSNAAGFMSYALTELGDISRSNGRILDFGCGAGRLVANLCALGWDAHGCDIREFWQGGKFAVERFSVILQQPYRLPYADSSFDAVISTSVLEHALNKEELFRELHRVLRPGGSMLHILPGKWYLPTEPHIMVPLVSWLWPHVPRWWLVLWAVLGIRNSFQVGLDWRTTVAKNQNFVLNGLSYWTHRRLRQTVERQFGNCSFPNRFFIDHAEGGFAQLARRLPLRNISAWLSGHFRIGLLLARKT